MSALGSSFVKKKVIESCRAPTWINKYATITWPIVSTQQMLAASVTATSNATIRQMTKSCLTAFEVLCLLLSDDFPIKSLTFWS